MSSSKLSFRSRQVDYTKSLPIYFTSELPDLADAAAAINRSVPQMPTGMEKDEESEHHLQRALSALQAFGATASSNDYAIPTPKVDSVDMKLYENIYATQFSKFKQYIRVQPFSNDYDYPDYDADYEDETWLNEQKAKLESSSASPFWGNDLVLFFENVLDRLEKATGHSTNLLSRDEAKLLLTKETNNNDDLFLITSNSNTDNDEVMRQQRDEFILCIYEYWKAKRLKLKHPLTPTVLTDKSGVVGQTNNPYVVFRRRTEKMQTRKNRKNEEQSYEKMLILKRDLLRAQQLVKLIKQREMLKKDLIKTSFDVIEKRYKLGDYDGHVSESIRNALRPQSSQQASTSAATAAIYANALSTLAANSSVMNAQVLSTFQNRINNINKSMGATGSAATAATAASIERTISSLIGCNKTKGFGATTGANLKRVSSNDHYDMGTQITVSKKQQQQHHHQQRSKDQRIRTPSGSNSVNSSSTHPKKASPPQIGSAMGGMFKKPPPLTVNQLTAQAAAAATTSPSATTKNRLIRRLTSARSADSAASVVASVAGGSVANNEKAAVTNYNLNECNEYDEQLKLNDIHNLDTILSETQNKLSTSVEKDGYWCFKRKEGCKYLAQNGSIFKQDPFDYFAELNNPANASLCNRLVDESGDANASAKTTAEIRSVLSRLSGANEDSDPRWSTASKRK